MCHESVLKKKKRSCLSTRSMTPTFCFIFTKRSCFKSSKRFPVSSVADGSHRFLGIGAGNHTWLLGHPNVYVLQLFVICICIYIYIYTQYVYIYIYLSLSLSLVIFYLFIHIVSQKKHISSKCTPVVAGRGLVLVWRWSILCGQRSIFQMKLLW